MRKCAVPPSLGQAPLIWEVARLACDQMTTKSIDPVSGQAAIDAYLHAPEDASRATLATAVRYTTGLLAAAAPGKSVELRVPPFAAIQCIPGGTHTRGTPRAAIQTDAHTWLALATGNCDWATAQRTGAVTASGERADLSSYLPLLKPTP